MDKKILYILIIMFIIFPSLKSSEFEDFMILEDQKESGYKIIQKVIYQLGDYTHISNIKTSSDVIKNFEYGKKTMQTDVLAVFPDKIRLSFEDKVFIINKNKGWLKYEAGYYENLTDRMIAILHTNLEKNLVNIVKNIDNYDFLLQEIVEKDDNVYEVLKIQSRIKESSIKDFLLYVDTQTYLPYKIIYPEPGYNLKDSGKIFEKYFLEFKDFGNKKYPSHTITYDEKGDVISENILKTLEFNVQYDPNLF